MNQTKYRKRAASLFSGALFLLFHTALFAQTAPIAIGTLTAEQFRDLPDRQVITSGEQQITLGELREQQRTRKTDGEAWLTATTRHNENELKSLEARHDRRMARQADRSNAEVNALMAHFALQIQENPEMERRAADHAAERKQLYKLWLDSTRTTTPRESRRIQTEAKRVLRSNNQ